MSIGLLGHGWFDVFLASGVLGSWFVGGGFDGKGDWEASRLGRSMILYAALGRFIQVTVLEGRVVHAGVYFGYGGLRAGDSSLFGAGFSGRQAVEAQLATRFALERPDAVRVLVTPSGVCVVFDDQGRVESAQTSLPPVVSG